MRRTTGLGLALPFVILLSVAGVPASAQADPAATIKERGEVMQSIREAAGAMRDMFAGKTDYDAAAVGRHARSVSENAARIPDLFPKGTGPEAGVPTEARAAIWEDEKAFADAAAALEKTARALAEAVETKSQREALGEFTAMTKTCSACHTRFRE